MIEYLLMKYNQVHCCRQKCKKFVAENWESIATLMRGGHMKCVWF